MKWLKLAAGACVALVCSACMASGTGYTRITPQEAYERMKTDSRAIVVDVRTEEEYRTGHVPNAVLLPLDTIETDAEKVLPDKSRPLLVYCRSGRRSAIAAEKFVRMGYAEVADFGGILTWGYEIEK